MLQESTLSKDTGMAVYNGVNPPNLETYAIRAKTVLVDVEETKEVAKKNNVELIKITGERGLIGALAAIWYANSPDESVKVLTKPG
jgi:tRNA(Ile2) C34 agmatinyltransferase TiaS